jgi:hypothetical protein
MSLSSHRQLLRGIKGLSQAQMTELQAFLNRAAEGGRDQRSTDGDVPETTAQGRGAIEVKGAADYDLPQPVCAQDEPGAAPEHGWGPPPLVAVQFDVIGCLIREANEARNARRQRFGM